MCTVERMNPALDLDAVVEIEAESFTNPWTREMFIWDLEHSDVSYVFVLRTPGAGVAGFCSFWLIFEELHINSLAVRTRCRGEGLGTRLLTGVIEHGRRLGALRATLEVRRSNEAALRLYTRLGFVVSGVRPGYYTRPVEDALILWRGDLGPP